MREPKYAVQSASLQEDYQNARHESAEDAVQEDLPDVGDGPQELAGFTRPLISPVALHGRLSQDLPPITEDDMALEEAPVASRAATSSQTLAAPTGVKWDQPATPAAGGSADGSEMHVQPAKLLCVEVTDNEVRHGRVDPAGLRCQ